MAPRRSPGAARYVAARARLSALWWIRAMSPATVPEPFAPFHADLVRLPKPGERQARIVFRGAAKTTLTRTLILHAIRYGDVKAVLLIRATGPEAKADAEALEIMAELCGMTVEKQLADHRIIINGVVVWLKSPKGKVRGLNYTRPDGSVLRPDLIVIDDLEDEESARSEVQTKALESFLFKAVLGTQGQGETQRAGLIMLGTPISPTTLIARAIRREGQFEGWLPPMVVPIIDADGRAAWPATYTDKLKMEATDDAWATEYMLEPLPVGSLIFPPGRTVWSTSMPAGLSVRIGVDPALGGKKGDGTGIVAAGLAAGGLWVPDALNWQGDIEDVGGEVASMCRRLNERGIKVDGVTVEAVGAFEVVARGIARAVAPIPTGYETPRISKLERATFLTPWHRAGAVMLDERLRGTKLDTQTHTWQRGTGATIDGHDDMPDALLWAAGAVTQGWSIQPPRAAA